MSGAPVTFRVAGTRVLGAAGSLVLTVTPPS